VERALDLTRIAEALGEHPHLLMPELLPSPPELQALMAEMEVRLFVRQPRTPEEVMSAAWYLHGVASSNQAFALYTPERQRRAFQISAHIFDLALDERSRGRSEQLQLGFAAEIGYRRGELDPNATAVYRRVQAHLRAAPPLLEHANTLAVEAAVALLGFDTARLFPLLAAWQQQLRGLAGDVGLDNLQGTMFGPAQRVVDGVEALLRFLTLGDRGQLEQARVAFRAVVGGEAGQGDLDARWVASHLLGFAENADAGSPWSVLPPDVPSAARQAFTLPSPVVLTLWPPQRELLTQPGPVHPLAPTARRVLLSVPTSAGKSLLAQLFAVAHLATQPGGVCYVTPLRSLGRELRRALQPRLQFLSKTLGPELPDSMPGDLAEALRALGMDPAEFADLTNVLPSPDELPDVEVMTPERLAHLLRHNADAVLNRFRLFVFDEVQLLAEPQRGFTLETLLAFLHWRTRTTNHRLVLLSASVGNRGQLMSWLDPDSTGVLFSSPWRGPRRLHAVFTTRIRWNAPTRTSVQSPNLPWRVTYPLEGIIRLRPAEGARTRTLGFTEPVGTIAFRANRAGVQQRSPERAQSTPNYKMTAQMVTALGHAGSVLVVTSTRAIARSMALEIAGLVDEEPRALQLVDFVRERLGVDHPLVAVLAHGVAFHHAALPIDILEALEEALRDGRVHYMTCTSTLTEGVNLPVRTVVIAETRYHGQPEDAQLTGPRLVNAMGRAGRAGKESEGWVVLVRATAERADDFDLFNPAEGDLEIRSRLASPDALAALAAFEQAQREQVDAVFAEAARAMADFISFIWFALVDEERRGHDPDDADLASVLAATLGHTQLDDGTRERWERAAEAVRGAYRQMPPARRMRWSRAGTSIPTARLLDELADRVTAAVQDFAARPTTDPDAWAAELLAPAGALRMLDQTGVLVALLALPERPRPWGFHATARTQPIEVAPAELLAAWLAGSPVAELAARFLNAIPDVAWRIEQMVDTISEQFEHFLPWMLGVLVELVNGRLAERGVDARVCPQLTLYVRHGVDTPEALQLVLAGVRSRRLVHQIVSQWHAEQRPNGHARAWLRSMSISQWRERFAATPSELRDLLEVARVQRASALRALLNEGRAVVDVTAAGESPSRRAEGGEPDADPGRATADRLPDDRYPASPVRVVLQPLHGEPAPLGLYTADGGRLLTIVPTPIHAELQAVLDTGLTLELHLTGHELTIELAAGPTAHAATG
jgi:hypothetical protein